MLEYLPSKNYLESERFPFAIEWHTLKPGRTTALHAHEFLELVYVAGGTGEHCYNGRNYRLSRGDVFVIASQVQHSYRVDTDQPLIVCNLLFLKELLNRELNAMTAVTSFVHFFYVEPFLKQTALFESHLSLSPHACTEMEFLLQRIGKEHKEKRMGYEIGVKANLIELFLLLSRCYEESSHPPFSVATDTDSMEYISRFVQLNYDQNLSIAQLCRMCGMSESKFAAAFRKHSGTTYIKFRNRCRIEIAKDMIVNSNEKIVSIAQQVGFEDISNFNRTFKEIVGMSPRQYRQLVSDKY
ncbi:MAG: transcriptional regulator, AraC family [Paenibacillaceae bacterium]|nr:transcriptional regulator, AraC family [Paenibacillaceae bacterium]